MPVGQQIEAIVARRGMTQRELAIASGVGESHLNTIIRGHTTPHVRTLENIAEAIGYEVRLVPKQQEGGEK